MVRDDDLVEEVDRVEPDIAGLGGKHRGLLAGRQAPQLGHPELDEKASAGREMARRIAEAFDLLGLGQHVGNAVVDQKDQGEAPGHPSLRHVAKDHGDLGFGGLFAQPGQHGG